MRQKESSSTELPSVDFPEKDTKSRLLNPGDFFFGDSTCNIHTTLGSCVAITLWHPRLRIGGMCHFVLPFDSNISKTRKIGRAAKPDGRYLTGAMELFERELLERGTKPGEYQAKIFGGSRVMSEYSLKNDEGVGKINIDAAVKALIKTGIPLEIAHVGKGSYQRVAFKVATGETWVETGDYSEINTDRRNIKRY